MGQETYLIEIYYRVYNCMRHTGNNDGGMNVLCWWGKLIGEGTVDHLCVWLGIRNQCICCYGGQSITEFGEVGGKYCMIKHTKCTCFLQVCVGWVATHTSTCGPSDKVPYPASVCGRAGSVRSGDAEEGGP